MQEADILEQARQQIVNKQYRDARRLLQRLPTHPTAQKWMSRIDDILSKEQSDPFSLAANQSPVTTTQTNDARSVARLVAVLVAVILVAIVIVIQRFAPRMNVMPTYDTFGDERIQVTYPTSWQSYPVNDHSWCDSEDLNCLLYLRQPPNPDHGLLFTYVPLEEEYDARYFADFNWEGDDPIYVKTDRRVNAITIAGIPAVAQYYAQVENDDNGGQFFIMDIYLTVERDGYVIHLFAPDACALESRVASVAEILSTLRIVDPVATTTDGFTEATPMTFDVPQCS